MPAGGPPPVGRIGLPSAVRCGSATAQVVALGPVDNAGTPVELPSLPCLRFDLPTPPKARALLLAIAWAVSPHAAAQPAGVQDAVAQPAVAQPPVAQDGPPQRPGTRGPAVLPLWEVGVVGFGVSQQAYPGSSESVRRGLPVPFALYRGEILRADRSGAGLRAIRLDRFELDIGVAAAFGSNSSDIEARRGMDNLGTLVEFGPRVKWHLGPGPIDEGFRIELPLRGVFDLEDRLASKGLAFEPALIFEQDAPGRWNRRIGVSAVVGDRRLAQHFYGVAPEVATPTRPAYEADAGLIAWRLSASFSRYLTPDLRLFGFLRVDTVAGAANALSPLVDRTTGASAGLGLAWTLFRSGRAAAD
jgi:outer membrane protein